MKRHIETSVEVRGGKNMNALIDICIYKNKPIKEHTNTMS